MLPTRGKRGGTVLLMVVAVVAGIAAANWQRQASGHAPPGLLTAAPAHSVEAATGRLVGGLADGAVSLPSGAASLPVAAMHVDAEYWRRRGHDGLLNPDLRRLFEQLLARSGDVALAQQWLAGQLAAADLARARELMERYSRYRDALAELSLPAEAQAAQAQHLARIVAQREALQREHFTSEEIRGLFDDDNRYDHYTVARLQLVERNDLSLAQKELEEQQLARQWFDEAQLEARQAALLPRLIEQQNDALRAAAASVEQREQLRSAQFGTAAAVRMARVDEQQQAWQARIAAYAAATPERQQQLRAEAFTASERLRLEGALVLYRERQQQTP